MTDPTTTVGKADAALDERLNDELDKFNALANPDFNPAEELTVRVQEDGELSPVSQAGRGGRPQESP